MESTTVIEDRENLNDFLEEAELQQYYELFRDILKVTKVSQLKFVLTEDLTQIGLSKPEQRRYKKIYSKYFPNPYISKIRKMLKSNKKRDQNFHGHSSIAFDTQPVFENNVKVPTKHIISIEDITINKELGMGQFGVVQLGTWTTGYQRLQVAIKCLGHERMTSNSTEFLKEAAVMHSIEHPNIVRLYGVVLHLDSLMLVTELAPLRSLLECLREVSFRRNFPVPNLCEFAEQICDGMTYLESKRLIHRDLAARNILVFSKDRVKISDFGLSRALGVGKDYYQTNYNVNLKLPVAWCAPECILFLRFTSASDVWAFGVCLWEMFTYGFQPWAAFSGQQILEAIDAPNFQRLERPECCPEAYYATMLECWAHDFNNRPKFKDLGPRLRSIRPEQVQATVNSQKPEDGRRNSFLEYKAGQIITILGKENMTKSPLWYGLLPGGACGMLDPTHTKAYTPEPPRQIVTPYKPSEDLEQVPLINPNSPSHLTGASGTTSYPMLASNKPDNRPDFEEVDLSCDNNHTRSLRRNNHRTLSEPTSSKSILSKVRSATLGRSHKGDNGVVPKTEEVHEYHEISDTDTEGTVTSFCRSDRLASKAENSDPLKSSTDFSQSLLEEIEVMFQNLDMKRKDEHPPARQSEAGPRAQTLSKAERKKASSSTMKPMSAADERTLNTAVAMANEITSRSMSDLDGDKKYPQSPNGSKFHFKFPLSLHHGSANDAGERDQTSGSRDQPRRNFSEEAQSVPDIQATLSEESKMAYTSLIEEPTPSTSLMSHIAKESSAAAALPATIPKPARMTTHAQLHSLQNPRMRARGYSSEPTHEDITFNPLPLPPRTNKPKLVDKPRHIRKYPLKMLEEPKTLEIAEDTQPNIYQNTKRDTREEKDCEPSASAQAQAVEDVVDSVSKVDTNPFNSLAEPTVNPFGDFFQREDVGVQVNIESNDESNTALVKERKDHVSVEDLLEFADQKPCGRQRGKESDEVRIMVKVLKDQANQAQCLEALELSGWNVHNAIKLVRVKVSVPTDVTFDKCYEQLQKTNGDIVKAVSMLVSID